MHTAAKLEATQEEQDSIFHDKQLGRADIVSRYT